MPVFQPVPLQEAMTRSTTSQRGKALEEYVTYLGQIGPGQAGKLTPADGETTQTVRRRLGAAAKMAGKAVKITRTGDEIYFWEQGPTRRRGRPKKAR